MKNNYPISATFIDEITYDIPSNNFSDKQWKKELDLMKKVGIDTVIIIRSFFNNKMIYPSNVIEHYKGTNRDLPDLFFKECEKRNMKVFLGMYIKNLTWDDGKIDNEIEKNKLLIKEVNERYGHYKSFYGWYIPHEVGTNILNIRELQNELARLCKEANPDKKVMISPFFFTEWADKDHPLSPKDTYNEWMEILKGSNHNIDYCAFQDGTAKYDKRAEYFSEAKKALDQYGVEIWANIETFDKSPNGLLPIDFEKLVRRVNVVKPIVSRMITFEFSHFMSPQSCYPAAKNLYNLYKKYYKK